MKDWDNWFKFDQSIIVYHILSGRVFGGSNHQKIVKQVRNESGGGFPGGDFTLELDTSNRSLVMWIKNERFILDGNIGDFQYSPIVILSYGQELTLL